MNRASAVAGSVFLILGIGPAALAGKLVLPIEDVGVIVGPSGEGRVLVRHAVFTETGPLAISRVVLRVPVAVGDGDLGYSLRVHPVAEPWNGGNVDWTAGWSRPGGAFEEQLFVPFDLQVSREGGEVEADITSLFEAVRDGDEPDLGYVLLAAPGQGDGVRSADLSRLGGFANGVVEVTFRRVSPPPSRRVR